MPAQLFPSGFEGNIRKFYLFRFLVNFQLWLPIWVVYLTQYRDFSLTEVTALDAAFWIGLVAMEVPTGAIADRYGRKTSLCYGALVNAVAIAVFAIAANYPIVFASYVVWALAWTLFSGADSAFFYDSLKAIGRESEYQKLFGRTWAIQSSGVLAALLIGAPLAAWTSLPIPILAGAVLMLAAWGVALTFEEPPRFEDGEAHLGYAAGIRQAGRLVLHAGPVRWFMLYTAVMMGVASCVSILTQPFLESHDVDIGHFGFFLLPGTLLGIFSSLLIHRVSGRVGTNRALLILPSITFVPVALLGAWDSLGAFVFYPLNGLVVGAMHPLVSDYLNQRVKSSQRATVLSIQQLVMSLVVAGFEPLLGVVGDARGLPAAYALTAAFLAVAAVPLMALWQRALRSEPETGLSAPTPVPVGPA